MNVKIKKRWYCIITKFCIKCERELTIEHFCKDKNRKDGLNPYCKECKKKLANISYEIHKKHIIEHNKQYHEDNLESINKQQKGYRDNNKDTINKRSNQYYKDNKEIVLKKNSIYKKSNEIIIKTRNIEYQIKNKEFISIYKKIYYQKNIKALKKYRSQYSKDNRGKLNIISQKHRNLKLKLPSTLTEEQWNQIKLYFNNLCCYCGKEKPLQQEHFYCMNNGGEYTINNIVPSCKSCNCSKGIKPFGMWYKTYKNYSKKRELIILKFLGYSDKNQQLKII